MINEVTQHFAEKKVFENHVTYIVNKNIVAFTVKSKYHEYVKDSLLMAFDAGEFFDIISHDNKLYILLKEKSNIYNEIRNFPSTVKAIEQINEKEIISATQAGKTLKK